MSQDSSFFPSTRTQLSAVLFCNLKVVGINPFVDSGADENFIAADFVELHNIPVVTYST